VRALAEAELVPLAVVVACSLLTAVLAARRVLRRSVP